MGVAVENSWPQLAVVTRIAILLGTVALARAASSYLGQLKSSHPALQIPARPECMQPTEQPLIGHGFSRNCKWQTCRIVHRVKLLICYTE